MYRNILLIILLLIAVGLGAMMLNWIRTGPVKRQSQNEIQVVEATELAAAFESAEDQAAEVYCGKRAKIRGLFAKAEEMSDGRFAMTFKPSRETFRPVRCLFAAVDSPTLNSISAGDGVVITGKIAGFTESSYFVTVEDCVLDKTGN